MRRRAFLAASGTAVTAGLAGCTLASGSRDGDVEMAKNAFRPQEYEATVGDTVVWVNNGSRGHTVTAYESSLPEGAEFWASGGFDTEQAARNGFWQQGGKGKIPPGESWEHTFETAGEYAYFCVPHERAGMVGTVVVTE